MPQSSAALLVQSLWQRSVADDDAVDGTSVVAVLRCWLTRAMGWPGSFGVTALLHVMQRPRAGAIVRPQNPAVQ